MLLPSNHPLYSLLFLFFLHNLPPYTAARPAPEFPWKQLTETTVNNYHHYFYNRFLNSRRGSHVSGLSEIKRYFHHFGYLTFEAHYNISDDIFDAPLESAILHYQSKLGLQVTGKLDFDTLTQVLSPRCGVPDKQPSPTLHATKNYVFFPGKPRWARRIPMTLTYGFSPDNMIRSLSLSDIKEAFKLAFSTWASVIPVNFVEADDYGFADIKIGFYSGDHGDGEPFDGVLGILAHSFSPESGKFHLDAAETWAVDFEVEKSSVAVDLESVAVHEIGHLLGLSHSPVKGAVMYPSLKPREKKVELSVDDIQGVQSLYGSNPNFTFSSLLESDISANRAADLRFESSLWAISMILAASFL
ncbi:Peptidase M10, metallopeptidase [Corchorus capsularis]|uniref:Peptidase M10, metallopeptidase n=1 Tax=Corchorus capsularis TaxID=210143 RepID=A0A1R3HGU6_COCAP|nr:Peptidase M10, metallopeptidase [Corchorus capsularis]